jgi:peptide/nickel transport system substrate-binding protein
MRGKYRAGLLASALALVASTCVIAAPAIAGASSQTPLNLDNEQGELWPCAFTPFNSFDSMFSVGTIYETLDFVNALENSKVTPWLATAYAWTNANKTLTFTIRSGVKWSDGTPFTAADVAYTFNLLKKNPALDLNAVWSVLSSVAVSGSNKVVFNFSKSAVPYFYYVADQVPIVPEHIWSKIKNPVTDPITKPVGTGGYELASCTPQNIQWKASPNYWQKGLAQVKVMNMPAFLSNNTANEYLAQGNSAWGAQFIPNIKTYFVAKKAGNTYWFPPVANVSLFPNLKNGPTTDVAVREAISYGINRADISRIGEYGYEPPASQTGIVAPTFKAWSSPSAVASSGSGYDPTKAKAVLKADGYKLGSNGFFSKNGQELKLTVITNGGYSDWVASMQVLSQELAKVGIDVTVDGVAASNFSTDVLTGKFQLAYDVETGGPTPFYEMRQWLFSKNSAPIGSPAASNWERYSSPAVDALLNQYGSTTSVATQHSIIDQLQSIMVKQLPVIPVLEEVDWFQYNTKEYSGWPTASQPYAQPGLYNVPDWGIVALHLKPLK